MKKILLCIGAGILLLSGGCGYSGSISQDGHLVIKNIRIENYFDLGSNTQIFSAVPQRVLVIGASQTEALLDLGVGDSIAYAVKYEDNENFPIKKSNQPVFEKLHFIPRQEITMENILRLHPDLIVSEESWYSKNKLGSTDYWNRRGIHTMVSLNTTSPSKANKPETVEKEMQYVHDLGQIFHKEEQANKIVNDTRNRFSFVSDKTKGQKKPIVMILDLLSTTISYGKNKIAGDIASHLGADVPDTTAAVSDEYIMKENPDVVFVVTYGDEKSRLQSIANKKAFQHLSFIRNHRLYPIPLKYAYGPITRTIDSAGYMAERIYPGQFHFSKEYDFQP